MSGFDFADRYAQSGIQPTQEMITFRKTSAARIQDSADKDQLLDLIEAYYGMKPDLMWFRDELRKEDVTFSLSTNERESVILAALILAGKVAEGDPTAILGVVAGSVQGKRVPAEAGWLAVEARSALAENASAARIPRQLAMPIRSSATPKLADEIAAAAGDLAALGQIITKVRQESQEAAGQVAKKVTEALLVLDRNARSQREESQILWWLFGEHSRALGKPFEAFRPAQAALIAGIELGDLTTASALGPVAAPAVLERVIRGAKGSNKAQPAALMKAIDDLGSDLDKLKVPAPARSSICPILTGLGKSAEIGSGAWANVFSKMTGLDAVIELAPMELAVQTYLEYLLGAAE